MPQQNSDSSDPTRWLQASAWNPGVVLVFSVVSRDFSCQGLTFSSVASCDKWFSRAGFIWRWPRLSVCSYHPVSWRNRFLVSNLAAKRIRPFFILQVSSCTNRILRYWDGWNLSALCLCQGKNGLKEPCLHMDPVSQDCFIKIIIFHGLKSSCDWLLFDE